MKVGNSVVTVPRSKPVIKDIITRLYSCAINNAKNVVTKFL